MSETIDVIVIGGGQAGLAAGYYLQRSRLSFVLLDGQKAAGGAWNHTWSSLRLFSPPEYSSLPGWQMPAPRDHRLPNRGHVVDYLHRYEQRYRLPIRRPVEVRAVHRDRGELVVRTTDASWRARSVVSATGTWRHPFVPAYHGRDSFRGLQVHSAWYRDAAPFAGKRVLVVGGGNSGAQILAELAGVADTTWVTLQPPRFLPDDVDGRVLFQRATRRFLARERGEPGEREDGDLGDIVMVPPVRQARDRGLLQSRRPFRQFTESGVCWSDESYSRVDAVVWCTGFRPALGHLVLLHLRGRGGVVQMEGTRAVAEPQLWLLGYGDWTGDASATLIGVGRTARSTVRQVVESLG
jgi:cation diffusion facilitator CzcD-associated flavoprotein CzcO